MLNTLYISLIAACLVLFFYRGNLMARFGAGTLTFLLVFAAGYLLKVG